MERQQAAFRIESRMKCRILLKGVQSPALPDVGNVLHLVRGGQLVRGIQMFPKVEVNRQAGCRRDSQTIGAVCRLEQEFLTGAIEQNLFHFVKIFFGIKIVFIETSPYIIVHYR